MSEYLLRCWRRSDAVGFRDAVDESLADLRQWMNWATSEPLSLEDTIKRMAEYERDFRLALRWRYAIVSNGNGNGNGNGSVILGGASIHQRIGDGGRDIGYWLRASARGRGIMTAAVHALTRVAFEQHEAERVEIHCDRMNERSVAVARRLGFHDVGDFVRTRPDGETRVATIYRLERNEFPTPRMLELRDLPKMRFEE